MLYLAAFRVQPDGTPDPQRLMILPPSVSDPADLATAVDTFAAFRAETTRLAGSAHAIRAAWAPRRSGWPDGSRDGGPDRAPAGLPAALTAGDLASPEGGRSLARSLPIPVAPMRPIAPAGSLIGRVRFHQRIPVAPGRSMAVAPIRFQWKGKGMGLSWYVMTRGTESLRLEIRESAGPEERRISTASDAEWQRDIAGSVGVLRIGSDPTKPVAPEILSAYNEWRLSQFVQDIADITADPAKYSSDGRSPPTLSEIAEMAPVVAHAAYWTPAGWVRV